MKLYMLLFSHKKNGRKTIIMIDSLRKCENYKRARESGSGKASVGFHEIVEAPEDSDTYKKGNASKNGGWISRSGFNPHT